MKVLLSMKRSASFASQQDVESAQRRRVTDQLVTRVVLHDLNHPLREQLRGCLERVRHETHCKEDLLKCHQDIEDLLAATAEVIQQELVPKSVAIEFGYQQLEAVFLFIKTLSFIECQGVFIIPAHHASRELLTHLTTCILPGPWSIQGLEAGWSGELPALEQWRYEKVAEPPARLQGPLLEMLRRAIMMGETLDTNEFDFFSRGGLSLHVPSFASYLRCIERVATRQWNANVVFRKKRGSVDVREGQTSHFLVCLHIPTILKLCRQFFSEEVKAYAGNLAGPTSSTKRCLEIRRAVSQ